jgi:hypothetical protein
MENDFAFAQSNQVFRFQLKTIRTDLIIMIELKLDCRSIFCLKQGLECYELAFSFCEHVGIYL